MKTFQQFKQDMTEGVAALAIPAGVGILKKIATSSALKYAGAGALTGIGALGTILQAKKRIPKDKSKLADIAREKGLDLTDPRQRRKATSLVHQQKMKDRVNNPDGVKNRL